MESAITSSAKSRRKNLIGDIYPNGFSFILYSNGKWMSKKKLGIHTIDEAIDWVRKIFGE
ncbi:hypothetical protein DMO16_21485 [Fictibacillus sp. S7]|nr:hypothetical protein DMO16_21485 [Fictibacillus sp. S7]